MKITNRLKFISIIILAAAILIAGAGTKLTDFFGENFKIPHSENNSTQNNQSSSSSEEISRLPDAYDRTGGERHGSIELQNSRGFSVLHAAGTKAQPAAPDGRIHWHDAAPRRPELGGYGYGHKLCC